MLAQRGEVAVAPLDELVHRPGQHGVQHGPAARRRALDAVVAAAHLVDGRVRPLPGLRDHPRLADRVEAPLVGEPLLGPGLEHDVHGLVEALAVLLLGHVVAPELGRAVAPPHAHVETALRDDVDQRHLLGQPQRVVERQDRRGQADPHPARARGRGGGQARRVHRQAVVDEVVLGEPDLVEPELLGPRHLLELAVDDLGVGEARGGLEEVEGPEAHATGDYNRAGGLHGDQSRRDRRADLPPVHLLARRGATWPDLQPVPGGRRAAPALPLRPAGPVPGRLPGRRPDHGPAPAALDRLQPHRGRRVRRPRRVARPPPRTPP